MNCFFRKRGQVWVETVVYTLVGLAIISLLLATTKPRIDEIKDKSLIEQSIEGLNTIQEKVLEISRGTGSRQILGLEITKGTLYIDAKNNSIYWIMETSYLYSEPGESVMVGNINITLTEEGEQRTIRLERKFDSFDLKFSGKDEVKSFEKSSAQYKISLENTGQEKGEIKINFEEV